jgi:hypothetical protein
MTATFYDTRSERRVAAALAEEKRAEAEARRAETALKLVQVEQARALAADDLAAKRHQRAEADKAARRARRAEARAKLTARLPEWLLSALWAAVIAAPITLAWTAQRQFAETTLHIESGWSWLFPLAVEAGAWVCAFEAHRRTRRGAPVGALPTWMWLLAGIAAGINLLHGTHDHSPVAGIALAAMSLLGVLLHHIRQTADQAAAEGRSGAELRRALWRRVRFPRLSYAAASIAAARGDRITVDEAWRAAWIDRYGVGPDSSRRDRTLARVIVRHQRRTDRQAAADGALTIVGGVILPVTVPGFEAAGCAIEAAAETVPTTADTPIVQAELSDKAAVLLIKVRAAVAAGELPAQPSGTAIRSKFGGASETAREVRDALRKEVA